MPTILWQGPYRFFFYSSDGEEPRHVHVVRDDNAAKFWLAPFGCRQAAGLVQRKLGALPVLSKTIEGNS